MIRTEENRIILVGSLGIGDFHQFLATMHNLINGRCYQDLILDLSGCTSAFPGAMLGISAQTCKFRSDSIDFRLIPPNDQKLKRLFINANWAYLIDPENFEKSSFRGLLQVPTTQFSNISEQAAAVNIIMEVIFGSLTGFTRGDLAAIEWSLNEITDNVINHSGSKIGGLVQLSTFRRDRRRVEYVVCDAGLGIPATLKEGMPQIRSDNEALDYAIREGVTKNKKSNQGNGLFGAFEVSRVSEGYMEIHSGYGSLRYNKKDGLHIKKEQVPYNGTLVVSCIDYSNPGLLSEALKFGGKSHHPIDFLEMKFENASGDRVIFCMKDEAVTFGSRKAAEPINIKLKNLAELYVDQKIFIDFKDVPVISSSFADEVFGKMFVEMGPLAFIQKFEFMNTSNTVRSLIDRAITLRSSTG
jgi:anti-sigma regulatory factor (Ser/Thr protein kinase)